MTMLYQLQPRTLEASEAVAGNRVERLWRWLWTSPVRGPKASILIRLMAGGVFLWEGILKFVYHNQGGGRFALIGIPMPETMATFVAVLEIVGGILLICGLFTRLISIPFIIEMLVAMLSTKIAMYFGTSHLPLPPAPPRTGFWAVLHEIRSEYPQLMSAMFLMIVGPGPWSIDAWLARGASHRARA
ncbi:DoxX family protein [Mycobacterium sp.]|uniref:DoxX family protein n=1 Tax=Mycobacterium sp. TaxID=1785 RepID=UPI003C72FF17